MNISIGRTGQIWGIAIVINVIVFTVLWFMIQAAGATRVARTNPPVQYNPNNTTAGGSFGQITRIVGDSSVADVESDVNGALADDAIPVQPSTPQAWVGEFYLDRGPALSFAPRVNSDGSPRTHPSSVGYFKAPTYEGTDNTLKPEDINSPVMSPPRFSKRDLPEEYRGHEIDMTVRIHIDARGRVLGMPVVVKSSGSQYIDRFVVNRIMDPEFVTFTPATRKDTGEPVPSQPYFPIFWDD